MNLYLYYRGTNTENFHSKRSYRRRQFLKISDSIENTEEGIVIGINKKQTVEA